jgi:hypothetical protein
MNKSICTVEKVYGLIFHRNEAIKIMSVSEWDKVSAIEKQK